MLPFQPNPDVPPTFEDAFFEHRTRLHEWALQLTGRNLAEAEDLIQELYIRLARVGSIPDHIDRVELYLFSTLRNLYHRLAQRARTSAVHGVPVVDYDSAERSLRAVDRNGVIFVREDLHRVCDYACERKNTSRSASIFILRFFLGYYPSEVMMVVQSTRGAVDKAIRAARNEARLNLVNPGILQPIGARKRKPFSATNATDSHDLFLALREKIFRSRTGTCFDNAILKRRYEQPDETFSTEELAHLVCCPVCLDTVNRILGLPLLGERSPDETIGRDTPQGPNGAGNGSGAPRPTLLSRRAARTPLDRQEMRRRMRRRLEEVDQHRPQRLSIGVDGEIRASQRVTAPLSEQLAELHSNEKPEFIEVLSEQNVCLAFVLIQALTPENGLRQTQEIRLSDGRTITVSVSFALHAPTVQVVYSDPLVESTVEAEGRVADSSPFRCSTNEVNPGALPSFAPALDRPAGLWDQIRQFLPFDMNPLLASATLFAVCSIVCFVLWTRSGPRIGAGLLLNKAAQSDVSAIQAAHSELIYQKVRINDSGHVMERAIYRDPQKRRRMKRQPLNDNEQWLKDKLHQAGVSWDEPLSVADYQAWHDGLLSKRDTVTQKGSGLLTLTTSTDARSAVLKESLTVRESDFHAVDRTIELRDAGTVEIAELNYDVMPWGAVNQDWLEPLAGPVVSDIPTMHAAIHMPHALSDLELDEAELAARVALNELHADTGEPIQIIRTHAGIEVKGVVDTNARKHELASHLAMLPDVHPSILSAEEIGSRVFAQSAGESGQPVQVHSVEAQPSPLDRYLREKKLPTDQLAALSHSLLDGSLGMIQAGVHYSELQPRFEEAGQLPNNSQNQLSTLSHTYLATIGAGLDANKRTLSFIGLDNESQTATPEPVEPAKDLNEEISHYRQLCMELVLNGPGEPRPAPVIARELLDADERLRLHLAKISASVPEPHN